MDVRKTHVAGSFYNNDAEALRTYVHSEFEIARQAQTVPPEEVSVVLLPHAGHFFCGHVIAQTLTRVNLPQTLIVLGPNHTGQGSSRTRLAVWDKGSWQSPLGLIPIAHELAQDILCSDGGFEADYAAHEREHSLEVLMPFLQEYVPHFSMVPICVGSNDFTLLQRAGLALAKVIQHSAQKGQDISIVVSSDMHHFSDHERTLELDTLALQAILDLDPMLLARNVVQQNISMCGVCPTIMALFACKALGAKKCNLVTHTTSYEKGGDVSRTVGYVGLFVQKNTCKSPE